MRSFQYHAGHYGANDKNRFEFSPIGKIILEASEQCGQSIVPTLSSISNFEDALKNASGEK